ncbi:WhiB family transcriptional regulator [Streptomyces sp. Li-HN-5-11]|uniref:WhiB family transcriptional regulator n=1 Tax=Streptomyces sp. Li-HN-5-11 TaxID=3075432 RepID=UPI0028B2359F|nr:WhiB family transcriptional regulator [Streptomyces sp. Li-HN-5-11]WNM32039.1 WhiB family transcriptional regulator [Streptomyces sp. Li-HN-5-11]WOP39190.1 WhiB family transcriptional regulator [Streptomyces sp. Li-HN-5-13]
MSWREMAACRFEDPELFFPVSYDGSSLLQVEQARQICRRCPVLHECRRWALRVGETDGVWGGLTPPQRRALSHSVSSTPRC